jgi:type II secretory pathway component PulF
MPTYRYAAQTQTGAPRSGLIVAASEEEAFRRLRADGLRPTTIRAAAEETGARHKWKPAAVVELLDDLAALLDGGVSLAAALEIAGDARAGEPIGDLAALMRQHVQSGESLDEAFAALGDRDAQLIAGVLAAGQASGEFSASIRRAADLIRVRLKALEDLVTNASYPAFLAFSSLLLIIFLIIGVLPSFEPMLETAGVDPPLLTAAMLGASRVIRAYGLWVMAALALAVIAYRWLAGPGAFLRLWSRFWLHGPLSSIGRPLVFGPVSVFLGMMLAGGVPAADAMRSAAAASGDATVRDSLEKASRRVREGESVSVALAGVEGYPRVLSRLAEIGGEIGVMGLMLARGGEVEQARAIRRMSAMTRAAGPVLILAVGAFIGLIMGSVFALIASIGDVVTQ